LESADGRDISKGVAGWECDLDKLVEGGYEEPVEKKGISGRHFK